LRLIADHKLRGVLAGPRQVDDLTDEIRAAGVAVVAGPARSGDPDKVRAGLVALGRAGAPLAYAGTAPAEIRQTAAWLANGGLPRPQARRGLITPAEPFALPSGTARLAPGDTADVIVWDGDPLDPGSRAVAVIAAGQRVRAGS
jgi:imidazolonepropionase-like amidohydrolase